MGLYHGWSDEPDKHADAVRGGVEISDFDDEVKRAPSKKTKPKPKRGCPGNDFKAHVYVWQTETRYHSKWSPQGFMVQDKTRPYTVDLNICCGCGKVAKRRYHWWQ